MLGEVLYAEGRDADALAEFDQACQVFLAYPNWLLQVKFQSSAGGMRLDPNRSRRVPSWGKSSRTFVIGQFSNSEQVLVGDLNYQTAAQQGGVVRTPMFWRMNVVEVMRMTALAIRRRSELLGPLAPQDAISKELSVVLGTAIWRRQIIGHRLGSVCSAAWHSRGWGNSTRRTCCWGGRSSSRGNLIIRSLASRFWSKVGLRWRRETAHGPRSIWRKLGSRRFTSKIGMCSLRAH